MTRTAGARRVAATGLLLSTLLAAGCVRAGYRVYHVEEPVTDTVLQQLSPGRDDLTSCLAKVGAPHFVWEYQRDGMALAWVQADGSEWDFDASLNVFRFASASLSLDFGSHDLPGVVLWFDPDLRLEKAQRGSMRELTQSLRRPTPGDGEPDD